MTSSADDPGAFDRAERRRRSGVRSGWVWGTVLLLALLIYLAAFGIMENMTERRWRQAVDQAFKKQDISEAAALLEACRIQAPRLARRAEYAVWQNRLRTLQTRQNNRKLRFDTQLAALKKQLDSENADHIKLSLALANIARNASDESELTQLRTLQARCEALAEMRELATARSGVEELTELQKLYEEMSEAAKKQNFRQFDLLEQKQQNKLKLLLQKYHKFPEITVQTRRLRKKFADLAENVRHKKAETLLAEQLFEEILRSNSLQIMQERCQNFLDTYPAAAQKTQVHNLLKQLQILQLPRAQKLKKQLAGFDQNFNKAVQQLQRDLQNIAAQEIKGSLRELILLQKDQKILSWSTAELSRFSQPDADGDRSITFTTSEGQKLQAVFDASAQGKVTVSGKVYTGRLYSGKAEGALPDCHWQSILRDIAYANVHNDFFRMLSDLPEKLQNDPLIPQDLKAKLLKIFTDAQKTLGAAPEQYIFSRSVIEFCSKHPIVFAGTVYSDQDHQSRFFSIVDLQKNPQATVWLVQAQKPFFKLFAGQEKVSDRELPNIAVIGEDFVDYAVKLSEWRRIAAQKNLILPDLPDYLQGM